jgi:hypothetical protein
MSRPAIATLFLSVMTVILLRARPNLGAPLCWMRAVDPTRIEAWPSGHLG